MLNQKVRTTLDLTITDLSRGGSGVARDGDGRVIFVPFTAPGDRVRVRLLEVEKRYAQAELLEVVEPSPIRQKARCPVFGRCGGCQWQHLPYEYQWKTKVGGIRHALSRVAVNFAGSVEELPAERVWEYRNRVQLRGENKPDATTLGFYAAKSHEIIAIERCDIARPEINSSFTEIRSEATKLSRPFKVEIEVLESGEVRKSWNQGHAAQGFRQVHDEQNQVLRKWVKSSVAPNKSVLDLFGGSGNLSLQLAENSPELHCVDVSAPSDAPVGTPEHFRFHRAPVTAWLPRWQPSSSGWSVIVDPPRIGLDRDFHPIVEKIEKAGVDEWIAVGCDPDAWARDVSRLIKRGWILDRVAALDLFPQTPHIESLARLFRPS